MKPVGHMLQFLPAHRIKQQRPGLLSVAAAVTMLPKTMHLFGVVKEIRLLLLIHQSMVVARILQLAIMQQSLVVQEIQLAWELLLLVVL